MGKIAFSEFFEVPLKVYSNQRQLLMNEITTLLSCLHSLLDRSTYRQLLVVSQSLLAMTGRVTMLGISRWAEQGGSYRTVQRFFAKEICWPLLNLAIIKALRVFLWLTKSLFCE